MKHSNFRLLGLVLLLAAAVNDVSAQNVSPRLYTVEVSALTQKSPPSIRLQWPGDANATGYVVSRNNGGTWAALAALPGGATEFTDWNVAVGTGCEYQVLKRTSLGYDGSGYVYAGIELPFVEFRGKAILLVDATWSGALAPELKRLQMDLAGDGWEVIRHDVSRSTPVTSVKSLIQSVHASDPSRVRALFLFGHIPVPYSGDFAADSHDNHRGAWPADVYYGDIDGVWTDSTVNRTTAEKAWNHNVPGDGKFDQSTLPSDVELQVGRVDLYNMTCFANKSPSRDELALLRQYLDKDHRFRHGQLPLPRRGLVIDNFGGDKEALASTGWRNFAPLFGAATSVEIPWGTFFSTLSNDGYLWAYGTGGGGYYTCAGVGGSDDFAIYDIKTVFTFFFGSYYGDWDNESNFLRAPLGSTTYTLTSAWGGRPHWFMHHMALGETIGFSTKLTQNNWGEGQYEPGNFGQREVHTALHGDPTLRLHPALPPRNLTVTLGAGAELNWAPPADSSLRGFLVYRGSSELGPFQRISGAAPVLTTTFHDPGGIASSVYMVRAVKLESSASGSYFNLSQGVIARASLPPAAPAGVAASPAAGAVRVSWEDRSSDETGFRIYRAAGGSFALLASTGANATVFNDTAVSGATTYSYRVTAVNAAGESDFSGTATVTTPGGSSAAFVRQDSATGGSWKGVYGREGYNIAQDAYAPPAYGSVAGAGNSSWVWNDNTSDPAALQRAGSGSRLAACWYANGPFELRFNFSDAQVHRVSLYFLDWDNLGRRQTLETIDADSGVVLDQRTVEAFRNGVYLSWDLKGRVTMRLRPLAGNAVVSGVFFDPAGVVQTVANVAIAPNGGTFTNSVSVVLTTPTAGATIRYTTDGSTPAATSPLYSGAITLNSSATVKARAYKSGMSESAVTSASFTIVTPVPPPASAAVRFNGLNSTRAGTWKGAVGGQGYWTINDAKALPSYAAVAPGGNSDWTWEYSTANARALQRANLESRFAACWYSGSSFDVDLNLTDGQTHRVQFYCVDWDLGGRSQKVELLDQATGQVLHSQTLSNFSGGLWLDYNVRGRVIARFTRLASYNAVLSGIFFDPPAP